AGEVDADSATLGERRSNGVVEPQFHRLLDTVAHHLANALFHGGPNALPERVGELIAHDRDRALRVESVGAARLSERASEGIAEALAHHLLRSFAHGFLEAFANAARDPLRHLGTEALSDPVDDALRILAGI